MTSPRYCEADNCDRRIPWDRAKNPQVKYCTPRCAQRQGGKAYRRRQKAKAELTDITDAVKIQGGRKGDVYDALMAEPELLLGLRQNKLTEGDIAIRLGVERSAVNRALTQMSIDRSRAKMAENWDGPPEGAVESLESFKQFRDRYFITPEGIPYTTEPYHQDWIDALLKCMDTGGRLMILSPPRHGKTQLLIHFSVWQIVKNPHIRIVWIAGNKDLAQDWIASIQEELESNAGLLEDFLPPGGSFRPPAKSRKSWSRTQFSVATQQYVVKSPTMVAVSRGSKILSRDVDLIIADDIEDHGSTLTPQNRLNTRNWWATDVLSRKEDRTGWFVIGSRQHPDDLYGHLLESEIWEHIVETAHDEANCKFEEHDVESHVDCMLWPDRHSYRWLMDQLAASETTGGRALWEMVYLNRPSVEGLMIFSREQMKLSFNTTRCLFDYPSDTILAAGLDPSATGYQAGFLWGYDPSTRKVLMVDLENEEGGGIPKARRQIAWWFDGHPDHKLYCRNWFIEDNLYRGAIVKDELLVRYSLDNHIELQSVHTDRYNKWDPAMGVTSMPGWYEAKLIDLPYGDAAARAKTDLYVRQCLNFAQAPSGRSRNPNGDLVMASWFPFPHLRWLDDHRTSTMRSSYKPSYASMTSSTMFSLNRRR